jgi:hypothetical protein
MLAPQHFECVWTGCPPHNECRKLLASAGFRTDFGWYNWYQYNMVLRGCCLDGNEGLKPLYQTVLRLGIVATKE